MVYSYVNLKKLLESGNVGETRKLNLANQYSVMPTGSTAMVARAKRFFNAKPV